VIRKDLLYGGQKLADTATELAGDEKEAFLDFVGGMLRWLPEERKTTKELLEHRFLQSFCADRARFM
jgi:serine/threonine-protein kinase SRPK3